MNSKERLKKLDREVAIGLSMIYGGILILIGALIGLGMYLN